MPSSQFTLTQAAGTSAKKFTVSMWFKLSNISTNLGLWGCGTGTSDAVSIVRKSDDSIALETFDGSANPKLATNRKFRDPAAWMHLVFSIDTTNATAGDRLKMWINGVEEISFASDTTITENSDIPGWSGSGDTMKIGNRILDGDAFFDGKISHVHVIDGTIYDASAFGETDSTSGIWKIKTSPSVTYGTNGGFYKFESATLTTDSSGESNTLTQVGSPTPTKDNPSNNFATFNPNLISTGGSVSNGNCSFASGSSINNAVVAPTLAASKGKWYWEAQVSNTCAAFGISDTVKLAEEIRNNQANGISAGNQSIAWEGNGYFKYSGTQTSYGSAIADATLGGTTLGFFADLDNNKLYLAEDGVIQNSGTGYTITAPASTDSGYYYLGVVGDQCSATANVKGYVNFGNGVFHTTVLTGTTYSDAGGTGTFKYSPNQGGASNFDSSAKNFYAVCTKNIKTYG